MEADGASSRPAVAVGSLGGVALVGVESAALARATRSSRSSVVRGLAAGSGLGSVRRSTVAGGVLTGRTSGVVASAAPAGAAARAESAGGCVVDPSIESGLDEPPGIGGAPPSVARTRISIRAGGSSTSVAPAARVSTVRAIWVGGRTAIVAVPGGCCRRYLAPAAREANAMPVASTVCHRP
jgi:hypothetical protein